MASFTFTNVDVFDGTGSPSFAGRVVVDDDRIAAVEIGDGPIVGTEIDGGGQALAPGFIDVHTHDDWALLADPDLGFKTLQGVTSVVTGNCGMSPFPQGEDGRGGAQFETLGQYIDALGEAGTGPNVACLVGHGAVRTHVLGLRENRRAVPQELANMAQLIETALSDGAIGMSSGLAYEPGRYSPPDELIALASVVAAADGIYTTHMRSEADGLLDSIDESIDVAEKSGVRLQISHLKAAGRDNWGATAEALRRIDQARLRGVDVMADQYPYRRGSTLLEQIVNSGALDGNSPFGALGPDDVLIAAAPRHPEWEGRTLTEIAATQGIDARAVADQIVEAEGRHCFAVIDIMSEDDVAAVMESRLVMIGSDGIPMGGKPHPRLGHTFPRVLGRYVREQETLTLPDAVHRMTGLPAGRFGFTDRGRIAVGAFADLVLFDPATIVDTGTYAEPTQVPAGISGVWVNGSQVAADGAVTGARPGRLVRGD